MEFIKCSVARSAYGRGVTEVERTYEVLNVLEFNSARKRMSVIVRDDNGQLLLLCKGADSVMFDRLAKNGRQLEENTKEHVNEYADAGLRTLILAYRELAEEEYRECIDKLAQVGIKIWVLTGDKMDIGFACSLLRQGMKQIIITLESPEMTHLPLQISKENVKKQILAGKAQHTASSSDPYALIIDGKSLAYALHDDIKNTFFAQTESTGYETC